MNRTLKVALIVLAAAFTLAVGSLIAMRVIERRTGVYTDGDTINQSTGDSPREILWRPPAALPAPVNSGGDVYEPRLSLDGRTLYFVAGRAGDNADIYVSTLTETGEGWSEPAPLDAINTERDELGPAPSPDGRTLFFYSNRPGGIGGYDLWFTTRGDADAAGAVGAAWSEPVNLGPSINTSFNEYGGAVSPDGAFLYFASSRPRPGDAPAAPSNAWPATLREGLERSDHDLYVSALTDGLPSTARLLESLSTRASEGAPAVSPVGDFLYFASNRPGGRGGFDLYRARILRGEHLAPEPLQGGVNTPHNELDPALGMGGFELLFSTDRPLVAGADSGEYAIHRTTSREVFFERRPSSAGISLADVFPWLLLLLALLALLLLLLAFLRWAKSRSMRPLSLLARCLLISLLVHMLLMLALTVWRVGTMIGDALEGAPGDRFVIDTPTGESGGVESQILADLTDFTIEPPSPDGVAAPSSPDLSLPAPAALAQLDVDQTSLPTETLSAPGAPAEDASAPPTDSAPQIEPIALQPLPALAQIDVDSPDAPAPDAATEAQPTPPAPSTPAAADARPTDLVAAAPQRTPTIELPSAADTSALAARSSPVPVESADVADAPTSARIEPPARTPDSIAAVDPAPPALAGDVRTPAATAARPADASNSSEAAPSISATTPRQLAEAPTTTRPDAERESGAAPVTIAPSATAPAAAALPSGALAPVDAPSHAIAEDRAAPSSTPAAPSAAPAPATASSLASLDTPRASDRAAAPAEAPVEIAPSSVAAASRSDAPVATGEAPAPSRTVEVPPAADPRAATGAATPSTALPAESTPPIDAPLSAATDSEAPTRRSQDSSAPAPTSAPSLAELSTPRSGAAAAAHPEAPLAFAPSTVAAAPRSDAPVAPDESLAPARTVEAPPPSSLSAAGASAAPSSALPTESTPTTDAPFTASSESGAPARAAASPSSPAPATAPSLAELTTPRAGERAAATGTDPDIKISPGAVAAAPRSDVPVATGAPAPSARPIDLAPTGAQAAGAPTGALPTESATTRDAPTPTSAESDSRARAAPPSPDPAPAVALGARTPTDIPAPDQPRDDAESARPINPATPAPARSAAGSPRAAEQPPAPAVEISPREHDAARSPATSLSPDELRAADSPMRTDDAARPRTAPSAAAAPPVASFLESLPIPTEITPPENPYPQRTPERRQELAEQFGGGAETERAVQLALDWLARHQSRDGRWDSDGFDQACGECGGHTTISSDTALTGLSVMCFLAAGHTHTKPGPWRSTVTRGIDFILRAQAESGDLRSGETMYSHGIASIALSEAYAMTGDRRLREPVERAIRFIVLARSPAGGWRYEPGMAGDTSVLGWQVMALVSAQRAGVEVPRSALDAARRWLDTVAIENRPGLYAYQPGMAPTMSMTAEGMFVQQLLGMDPTHERMAQSADFITTSLPEWRRESNTYGWYYATLALFQHQGEHWDRWNGAMKNALVLGQRTDGKAAGSWDPADKWSTVGGRVYQTAICTLSLEVYYRYLPLFLTSRAAPAPGEARDNE